MKYFLLLLLFSFSSWGNHYVLVEDQVKKNSFSNVAANMDPLAAGPLVEIHFENYSEKYPSFFGRLYASGTSGQQFEYFIYQNNSYYSLGVYPELFYDSDDDHFYAFERDGHDVYLSKYQFESSVFKRFYFGKSNLERDGE